ncbi:MAG: alpha amylase C-terminal domain-containing protein, partial [Rhizobacter sp.]
TVIAFMRYGRGGAEPVLVAINLTPMPRSAYRLGVPRAGHWREIFNSDAQDYGGSGWGNLGGVSSKPAPSHGREHSVELTLPPLSTVVLKHEPQSDR